MSLENKWLDENKDWYLDSSEIKQMKIFFKKPENIKKLANVLKHSNELKVTTKTAFQNTINEIHSWNSNLSWDDQIVILRSYKNVFGNEAKLPDDLNQKISQDIEWTEKTVLRKLKTMHNVFRKNEKEWFGEIDKDEKKVLLESEKILSKQLKRLTLQISIATEQWVDIWDMQDNLRKWNKQYLKMLVWVWDKYEWAGSVFAKLREDRLKETVPVLVESMNSKESLKYLSSIHRRIDDNDFQSDNVKSSYQTFTKQLHRQIFEKIKKIDGQHEKKVYDEEAKNLLRLAKIITWRQWNIDDELKDPQLSSEIVVHLIYKKDWIMKKLGEKIKIEDEKVGNKAPWEIVKEFKGKFKQWEWAKVLQMMWFKDISTEKFESKKQYEKLSLQQKVEVSTLVRLMEAQKEDPKKDLWELLQTVAKSWYETVIWALNENFDASFFDWNGKGSEDYWLKWTEADIFNLFNDIQWNWLFDFSDETMWTLKEAGKIWAMLGVWLVAWLITAPILIATTTLAWVSLAVATWVSIWATCTTAWALINMQGYDTKWDAWKDLVSDLFFNSLFWWIWAWVTAKFGKDIWREIAKSNLIKELWKEWIEKLWKEWFEEAIVKWINSVSMKDKITFIKTWMWLTILAQNFSIETVDFLVWTITEKYRQLLVLWKNVSLQDTIDQWLIVLLAGKVWWKAIDITQTKTKSKTQTNTSRLWLDLEPAYAAPIWDTRVIVEDNTRSRINSTDTEWLRLQSEQKFNNHLGKIEWAIENNKRSILKLFDNMDTKSIPDESKKIIKKVIEKFEKTWDVTDINKIIHMIANEKKYRKVQFTTNWETTITLSSRELWAKLTSYRIQNKKLNRRLYKHKNWTTKDIRWVYETPKKEKVEKIQVEKVSIENAYKKHFSLLKKMLNNVTRKKMVDINQLLDDSFEFKKFYNKATKQYEGNQAVLDKLKIFRKRYIEDANLIIDRSNKPAWERLKEILYRNITRNVN